MNLDTLEKLRGELEQEKRQRRMLKGLLERRDAENKAQLAELHAISEALGTSEGHSSVYWIERLKKIEALCRMQHEALRFNESMWQAHKFRPHADAQEALAAYDNFNKGE